MFQNQVQNWRNASWEGHDLTSQKTLRTGTGFKKLILKGNNTPYSMDNLGNGKFIESLNYFYWGDESQAETLIRFYLRGDAYDIFSPPESFQNYTLIAEFKVSTESPDQIQPVNIFVPPWAWLYAATSTGDKWTINLSGLDSDWVADPKESEVRSGTGSVVSYTGESFCRINIRAVPPIGNIILS